MKINKTMTLITRRVCLDPEHLDSNIMKHLFKKIVQQTKNECSLEHGFIISVKKITKLLENRISSANTDIVFTVQFEADTLKPIIDKNLVGTVCMIFSKGIFLDIQNKLKVLIPIESLNEYKLDPIKMCYVKGDKRIQKNDILTVQITGTEYSKQNFSCFGKLFE